jgi:Flp pilus assembly pilin Flp
LGTFSGLSPFEFDFRDDLILRRPIMKTLKKLWQDEQGQDLTEYALLVVLISLVAIASMQTMGATISDVFTSASTNLTTT